MALENCTLGKEKVPAVGVHRERTTFLAGSFSRIDFHLGYLISP